MADEASPNPSPAAAPAESPFDLGDTELELKSEPTPPAAAAVPAAPAAPAKPLPPRDETGKFTKPKYLVRQALDYGFTQEEIDAAPAEQLGDTLYRLHKQREQFRSEGSQARTLEDQRVQQPEPPRPAAPPAEEEIDLGLDETQYDPPLLGAIKKIARDSHAKIKALEAQLGEQQQREVVRETRSSADLLDAAFDKLGEKYHRLFGQGPAAALGADGQREMKRRVAVLHEAGVKLGQVNRHTIVKQLKEAADLLYGAPEAQAADPYAQGMNGKPAKPAAAAEWEEGGLARPTGRRNAPEPTGDQRAINNLTTKMREANMLEPDSDVMDGLLG